MIKINQDLKRQLLVNVLIIVASVLAIKGVSYASDDTSMDNKNLLIQTGNMQVILSTPNERYDFSKLETLPVTDYLGLKQNGYHFSVKNTGNIPIEYYEIRLVDEENKLSTLPHKYLRFAISKEDGEYSSPMNLGDNDSILYSDYNLDVGESVSYDFKLWLDGSNYNVFNKELYAALEITLFQKYDVYDNYLLYDANGGAANPVRTSICDAITTAIPTRDKYVFLGWSTSKTGIVNYHSGETYNEKKGKTLYAVWKYQQDS